MVAGRDAYQRGNRTSVIGVALHKDVRRQGLGKKIVLHLLEKAKEQGYRHMIAGICHENAASLGLFHHLGFTSRLVMKGAMSKFGRDLDDHELQFSFSPVLAPEFPPLPAAEAAELLPSAYPEGFRVFEPSTDAERRAVVALQELQAAAGTLCLDDPRSDEGVEKAVEALKKLESGTTVVGVENARGQMVASGRFWRHSPKDGFDGTRDLEFFTHPDHPTAPFAAVVLSALVAKAKSQNIRELFWYGDIGNTEILECLSRVGFVPIGCVADAGEKFGRAFGLAYMQHRVGR
ncbi:hypothetical protein HDU96_007551 [Phlyctochytrium bullatum]|nr:hypothetical protein HDU96_007551 [Phlyctochytrium bullatum]